MSTSGQSRSGNSGRRPIVLISTPGPFYGHVLRFLGEGFVANGYPCIWRQTRIDQPRLALWAKKFKPLAVLEINRPLSADVDWPSNVPHLAWINDYRVDG